MPATGPVYLGEAVLQFLAQQKSTNSPGVQQELQRLVRWYGKDKDIAALKPWEIENFGENSGAQSLARLTPVKAFLSYVHRQGITPTNLATHLKVKRASTRQRRATRAPLPAVARLSPEGYQRAQQELEALKAQRIRVAEDIKRAMADKDFRENAPLDAARDQQAHLEARIRELEGALTGAEVMAPSAAAWDGADRSRLGSRVVVHDLDSGEEISYTLVDRNEVDLGRGKISVDSPVGKAFLNRAGGEVVDVEAPGGTLRYVIERVDG